MKKYKNFSEFKEDNKERFERILEKSKISLKTEGIYYNGELIGLDRILKEAYRKHLQVKELLKKT